VPGGAGPQLNRPLAPSKCSPAVHSWFRRRDGSSRAQENEKCRGKKPGRPTFKERPLAAVAARFAGLLNPKQKLLTASAGPWQNRLSQKPKSRSSRWLRCPGRHPQLAILDKTRRRLLVRVENEGSAQLLGHMQERGEDSACSKIVETQTHENRELTLAMVTMCKNLAMGLEF